MNFAHTLPSAKHTYHYISLCREFPFLYEFQGKGKLLYETFLKVVVPQCPIQCPIFIEFYLNLKI